MKRGETLPIEAVWELSRRWYHNRLSPDYHGRILAEVEEIFRDVGLHAKFWYSDERKDAPQK